MITRSTPVRRRRKPSIQSAKDAVLKAAIAWVETEDDGTIPGLKRTSRADEKLVSAVTRLQRRMRRDRKS